MSVVNISRQWTRKVDLCLYLLNNRTCPGRGCQRSHNMRAIQAQQRYTAKKPCTNGPNCAFLLLGHCGWYHPNEHWEQAERVRIKRVLELTRSLKDLETLVIDHSLVDARSVGITQDRHLASFNKVSNGEIAVPGTPPRLTPLAHPRQMPRDSDNKAICFDFPQYTHLFEPLLRSVETMQPTFNLVDSVDVVSNANNLRKLFSLLSNDMRSSDRYDIEMKGSTLLLSRWNDDPNLSHSFGCGAGFERETCQYTPEDDPVLQGSLSHHRVVSYSFGGLQCVVQSEVDAYYCDCDHSETPAAPILSTPKHKKALSDPSPLPRYHQSRPSPNPQTTRFSPSTAFAALTLDDPGDSPAFTAATPPTTVPSPTLRVHHTGHTIPAPCLVEVKTQNARTPPRSTYEEQLYFSRRTKLYLAHHEKGLFTPGPDLVVRDMTEDLEVWEKEHQVTLRKLAALLRVVRERVSALRAEGIEKVSLVCECDGKGWDGGVRVRLCERGEGEGLLPP
ncbi:hypothetical protein C8A01DRAFT_16606 [Parachaetomium inaequale]|uniref:C3H1-type domain-containing protein n=1 Tax=Parachaetomium inaequale TaxID=2588326 RepID=A0AAN6PG02_9PEZI|nr:hypothetical protein C8A01DRAFT_16606 [Parachaetomium inaequale]